MFLIKLHTISKLACAMLLSLFLFGQANAQDSQWLNKLDLSQYQNKVVYIDFWASWCGPCRKSFPWINDMQQKYQDNGLVIIGVNLDTDMEKAELFLTQSSANFKLFSDPSGTLAEKYNLVGMPSSFVIDGEGVVRHRHVGFKQGNTDEYEKSIVSLLNELPSNKKISI